MNIRTELEKFIDTRPFNDKQLYEMWKKSERTIKSKDVVKEARCRCMYPSLIIKRY